uniref:Ionotropic glutamate receptor C-terminal domain-containing protein n=1 Tax=Anopheles coluzzii TaxID=1518534 RepID=A0A8W7PR71_ANOCL
LFLVAVLCIPIKLVSVLRNHSTTVRRSDAPGGAPAFFLVLFSFHLTGLSEIPHLSSGRCTSFFILLFGYLMYQYYSASIVGTLLMEQPKSIKTLRNLIDSRLTLGIEDIPYSRDYFVRTTDADSLELHRTRIEYYEPKTGRNESNFLAAADGLQLVREGGYAFHVAISAAYRIIRLTFSEREICELSEIDMFPVWSQWMVAIVQKNSPYRDVITYG